MFCVFCLWVFASLFRLPGWHLESNGSLDYVSVRASLTFANVNALINLIHTSCDMQSNVVNDLARAKRRWTEKKKCHKCDILWMQSTLDDSLRV